jgi:hypothetical protein
VSSDGASGQDGTAAFAVQMFPAAVPVVPVPVSPWIVPLLALLLFGVAWWWHRRHPGQTGLVVLFVLLAGSGLAWAATAVRDGNVGDWAGVAPAVTDAAGDAPVNADLLAVFHQQDDHQLYLRFDADLRKDPPINQAPTVTAGPAQTITLPALAALAGSASDDGLPNPPGAMTLAWSKVSGPGTVTFANPASVATTASFDAAGTYVLRLTASDSLLSASADVTITVNPQGASNLPPTVSAGPNQSIVLPAQASLSGTATDDGLPNPPAALTLNWSKVSGPGTVTFANPASVATTASFSAAGVYVLRLTANDGALSAAADVTITVTSGGGGGPNQPPTASAGPAQTITLPAAATLAGSASDDGLPNPPGTLTTTWSFISGPSSGLADHDRDLHGARCLRPRPDGRRWRAQCLEQRPDHRQRRRAAVRRRGGPDDHARFPLPAGAAGDRGQHQRHADLRARHRAHRCGTRSGAARRLDTDGSTGGRARLHRARHG